MRDVLWVGGRVGCDGTNALREREQVNGFLGSVESGTHVVDKLVEVARAKGTSIVAARIQVSTCSQCWRWLKACLL